ncbi:epidermal retinol dehydrogenase 2 [Dryobates pubescens]|uniref:epidermal retinol dehydrogenase 2 n=1 Tax=Dryobates pubescens TaxID=118200 RepID=UPI0023B9B900|nr:epidermal retinol dehydrogenase 2 [Dryobates pubescens]
MFNCRSLLKVLRLLKLLLFQLFEKLILLIRPRRKKSFIGEVVLITGSANGIGRQIVLKFAPMAATLVLWDIDDEGNEETSKLAQQLGARRVFTYHCDCSSKEEVYKQADKVREEIGDVTILINNAGIAVGKKFLELSDEEFEKTIRVNFLSQVWTCKTFLPAMMAQNHGHLVTTDSAALMGVYRFSDYSASKYATLGMMEAINWEVSRAGKDGIKTTIVCPYFVNTALARGFESKCPLLLPVYEPEHVAGTIMDAIQKDKFYVMLPPTLHIAGFKMLLPRKIILFLLSCLKIAESMDRAYGRKKKDGTKKI